MAGGLLIVVLSHDAVYVVQLTDAVLYRTTLWPYTDACMTHVDVREGQNQWAWSLLPLYISISWEQESKLGFGGRKDQALIHQKSCSSLPKSITDSGFYKNNGCFPAPLDICTNKFPRQRQHNADFFPEERRLVICLCEYLWSVPRFFIDRILMFPFQ